MRLIARPRTNTLITSSERFRAYRHEAIIRGALYDTSSHFRFTYWRDLRESRRGQNPTAEENGIPRYDRLSLSLTKAGRDKRGTDSSSSSLFLSPGPAGCFLSSPTPEISVALVNLTLRDIIPFRRGSRNNRHSTTRRSSVP